VPRIKLPGRRLLRLSRSGLQNQRQNLVRANFAASKSKNQKLLWGGLLAIYYDALVEEQMKHFFLSEIQVKIFIPLTLW